MRAKSSSVPVSLGSASRGCCWIAAACLVVGIVTHAGEVCGAEEGTPGPALDAESSTSKEEESAPVAAPGLEGTLTIEDLESLGVALLTDPLSQRAAPPVRCIPAVGCFRIPPPCPPGEVCPPVQYPFPPTPAAMESPDVTLPGNLLPAAP